MPDVVPGRVGRMVGEANLFNFAGGGGGAVGVGGSGGMFAQGGVHVVIGREGQRVRAGFGVCGRHRWQGYKDHGAWSIFAYACMDGRGRGEWHQEIFQEFEQGAKGGWEGA